ncbi:MAG: cyclic pyranopterin monophosphate synthase MoaC [Elusimicrobiota bacterium]
MSKLTHIDGRGRASMVDVGAKPATRREAVAYGRIALSAAASRLLREDKVPKGDVFAAARIAGIQAAKRTGELIPLCHPLGLDAVEVGFRHAGRTVHIRAVVRLCGRTGVEMEALTAVSIAALTFYDMLKAADKAMVIGPIRLGAKSGGRSGRYTGKDLPAEGPWR